MSDVTHGVCGMEITVPTSVTPLAAVVVVKAFDEDGDVVYFSRATDGLSSVEALGMAEVARMAYLDAISSSTHYEDE